MKNKKPKFLRTGYTQYSKLGLRRKKKQKYRKAKGGENKMRLKMKGHLRNVSIGFRTKKENRGLINGLKPVIVRSIEDLKKLKKDEVAVVAKLGNKKKKEIAEYSLKNNIRLLNLNSRKFLEKMKNIEEKKKLKKEELRKKSKVEKKEKEEETKLEDSVKNIESDIKENVEEKK